MNELKLIVENLFEEQFDDVLKGSFDIEKHKAKFVNYLEVVILEDGVIEYAVPSHQEKLIRCCLKKYNLTRQELNDLCPPEYYFDFNTWLSMKSGVVPVWNDFYMGECNEQQRKSLQMLKDAGLYKGEI